MNTKNYLLGRLSVEDAEKLEARMIEDENAFDEVRDAEADLFDEFARGELEGEERAAFAAKYGTDPRLAFATAMARRAPRSRKAAVWTALAAAAAAAFAVVMLNRPAADQPVVSKPMARPAAIVPPVIATLTLETSRAAEAPKRITIPAGATTVEIRVPLHPEEKFARYRAELTSMSGTTQRIDANQPGADHVLPLVVSAGQLASGTYELAVYGDDEPLGFVTFEVRRQ